MTLPAPWTRPTHAEMRELIREAISSELGLNPIDLICEPVQAVAGLETAYASSWKEPGVGSCNFGATQCVRPRKVRTTGPWDDCDAFAYVDTHPVDGSNDSKPYHVAFTRDTDYLLGAARLVRTVYGGNRSSVLLAAQQGNAWGVSAALRATGYYEGVGPMQEDRIRNHFKALSAWILAQRGALAGHVAEYPPCKLDLVHATPGALELLDMARSDMQAERDAEVAG